MLKIKCRQAALLLCDSQDRPLALNERLPLRMHLLVCPACRNFRLQLRFLRQASRGYADAAPGDDQSVP